MILKWPLLSVFLLSVAHVTGAEQLRGDLLQELDMAIESREIYVSKREGIFEELKNGITPTANAQEKYRIYSRLFDEYRSFQSDSAIVYAKKKIELAQELKEEAKIDDSKLNLAEIYGIIGLYKEALDLLGLVNRATLNTSLVAYYYHIHCTVYRYMEDFAVTEEQHAVYHQKLREYGDSLVKAEKPGTNSHIYAIANQLIINKQYKKSYDLLYKSYLIHDVYSREATIAAYLMALCCKGINDVENEKKYLALSAIGDIRNGVKENISLRELAFLLYLDGDLDRAYAYMKVAMDDALFCNSHMRMMEISKILPIVNNDYQTQKQKQNRQLFMFLMCISILSVLLLLGIIYSYKQVKKMRMARQQLKETNEELQQTNIKLEDASVQLHLNVKDLEQFNNDMYEMNEKLKEANCIKETYIVRYMDLCSEYIDKMEIYLNKIKKLSLKGDIKVLNEELNPVQYINENLELFYSNFDLTFLHLFPTFVEDFNKLLKEDHKIELKSGELLSPELRIYALVRLGITDNIKISRFLRYSLSTIYNYRTQVRNKAIAERAEFEKMVMLIGLDVYPS